ncbi:SEC-C metal-binding domain-containing protein [uncultured Clostridium sp.]|uniref:SEC-C metal-binding domain-containing protein n=1 Tax=uncultured Clostridium sp. TaxID=59620 RepID=UPI0025E01504|nr:SEC-C metal-binding domain-containing protein [uncultured Clostridium sp.]
MQNKKYYYDEQIKNYFYEEHVNSFSKVKGSLKDTKLTTLLGNETKYVLVDIAKRIELKGYSKLSKDGLVNTIADNIINEIPSLLSQLTYKEVKFLEKLCDKDFNEYIFDIQELSLVGGLASLGLLAKLNISKELYLVVSEDIKSHLKEIYTNNEYMENLKERSKGIAYIDGLLIHYGLIDGSELYRLISEADNEFINKEDLDFYLNYIFRSYEAFTDANAIIHPFVLAPEDIFAEVKVRQTIPYEYNKINYFIALGEDFKGCWTKEIKYLREVLAENGIEEDKLDSLVTELVYYIKNEIGTMSIVNLLETRGIVFKEDSELSSKLISAVAEVYNNTPIWTLKGLTAIELENRRSTTIVKEKQPGRNDPCPCGSGKKYKKCCGK